MRICDCVKGVPVYYPIYSEDKMNVSRISRFMFGHIAGFTRNPLGELIVNVEWESGETFSINPSNIQLVTNDMKWGEARVCH